MSGSKSLHVGGLPFETTDQDLSAAFPDAVSGSVIIDRETGRSRGFGFVEFPDSETASAVLEGLGDDKTVYIENRPCRVNYARGAGGRGGGGRGGGRGGYGGGRGGGGYGGGGYGGGGYGGGGYGASKGYSGGGYSGGGGAYGGGGYGGYSGGGGYGGGSGGYGGGGYGGSSGYY